MKVVSCVSRFDKPERKIDHALEDTISNGLLRNLPFIL